MRYTRCYMLFALLLVASSLRATVIREDFARMVDYAGWQLVDAYMKDYVRLRPDMVGEKEGYRLFQRTYNTTNYSAQKPPNSEAIRLFLISHEWRSAGINLYAAFVNNRAAYQNDWTDAQATDFLQNKIDAISPEALGAQSNADYTTLQATKKQLKLAVAQSFMGDAMPGRLDATTNSLPTEAEVYDDTSFTTLADDTALSSDSAMDDEANRRGFVLPPTTIAEESTIGPFGMLNYAINPISLGATILVLLLLLYLFGLFKRLDDRVDKHSKRIEDLTTRLFLKKDPVSADELKQLKAQVASLQEQVKKLKAEPQPSPPTSGANRLPLIADQHEYYLSTPNSDGTFNTSSMSNQFRPSASVYKFMITEANGAHRAEFTVASDHDAVKDALSSPGSYLDPVCESINPHFSGAKRIVNIRPGKAVKQGDKWVVKPEHKARIRYE